MAPYSVIQRGYGGAKFEDFAVFTECFVHPHDFRAVAIFVANSIRGVEDDLQPKEVGELFQYIVNTIRKRKKETAIFCIEITPTSNRWKAWEEIEQSNRVLEEICKENENIYFSPTAAQFLNEEDKPCDELFIEDLLHLNRDGYQLWIQLIKAKFAEVIPVKRSSK